MEQDDILKRYKECKINRLKDKNLEALKAFKEALKIMNIKDEQIFEPDLISKVPIKYRELLYKLLEEFSIFSYYIDLYNKRKILRLIDRILFRYFIIRFVNVEILENNLKYYMDKIKYKYRKQIIINCEKDYKEFNPSIINTGTEFIINCRTSNYYIGDYSIYCKSTDGIINTKNYIIKMDYEFNIISQKELIDKSIRKRYEIEKVKGLEDLIIFYFNDELCATCTLIDGNEERLRQIGLLKINETNTNYEINNSIPLDSMYINKWEKNWLPFIDNNNLFLVYNYDPIDIINTIINDHNKYTGEIDIYSRFFSQLNLVRFRGSAGPLRFYDNLLIVIHEVSKIDDKRMMYNHRFILLNNNYEIIKLSDPWYFEHHGVEFCRGICDFGDDIILSVGIEDEEAWLYVIDKEEIWDSLEDINKFIL